MFRIVLDQGRRKHFRIGQAMKHFSLALLATFLSTITTCKASLWLVDASWVLKLMLVFFQFLKPLLVKARLPLLPSILLDLSADTHTHSKIQCYLGCGSGNATRATWKNRTPGTPSSLPFRHLRTINQSSPSGIK